MSPTVFSINASSQIAGPQFPRTYAVENKRDSPPGRWMPSNERFHCQYVRQFSFVAREYGLSVDRSSAAVINRTPYYCS